MFFPIKSSNNTIIFDYTIGTNKQFEINFDKEGAIITFNKEKLKEEEIFEQNYPQIKIELQNEKKQYSDKCKKKHDLRIKYKSEDESEGHCKENIDNKPKIIDTNITNNIIEQNKNEKKIICL